MVRRLLPRIAPVALAGALIAAVGLPGHADKPEARVAVASRPQARRDYTLDDVLNRSGRLSPTDLPSVSWVDANRYAVSVGGKRTVYDAKTGQVSAEESPVGGPAGAGNAFTPRGRRRGGAGGGVRVPGIGEASSPDGRRTISVRKNDIYVNESGGGERRVTSDGSTTILNGILDWVYDEEIYGRGSRWSYVWSPDSKQVAYLRLDEAKVPAYSILNHLPQPQAAESWQYPTSGEPNPGVRIFVANVADNSAKPVEVDLSAWPDDDRLVVKFGFSPDGATLLVQVQNRIQNVLELLAVDPATGRGRRILHEESPQWIDVPDTPTWLADGSFLWMSDKTGFRHLYRYKTDGTLMNAVTKGDWDVKGVQRIDEADGTIYFDANGKNVTDAHTWRARLDGAGDPICLTDGPGTHRAVFNSDDTLFIDNVSSAENPGEVRLCDARTGRVLRVIGKAGAPEDAATHRLGKPVFVTFAARDGYKLEGTLLLPPDYTPGKHYPVFCPVYAGPSAPTARNAYSSVNGSVEEQFYAQHGIIVWKMDNRSANPRGAKAQKGIYGNFGASELSDIEDGLKFLIGRGYADPNRIAISGWSYGGFMTEYALTHSSMFKVGIAGAGPTDWHLYDTIYTERYMSTPQKNPDGYRTSSVVGAAANLKGKLLILHGMMDDNVHLQNTVRLVEALQRADRDFTMMIYPGTSSRHGIGNPQQNHHLRRTQIEFLLNNL